MGKNQPSFTCYNLHKLPKLKKSNLLKNTTESQTFIDDGRKYTSIFVSKDKNPVPNPGGSHFRLPRSSSMRTPSPPGVGPASTGQAGTPSGTPQGQGRPLNSSSTPGSFQVRHFFLFTIFQIFIYSLTDVISECLQQIQSKAGIIYSTVSMGVNAQDVMC